MSRPMSRHTLADWQWERVEGDLPGRVGTRGRSGVDHRLFMDAILWMAGNAARWRDLPGGVRQVDWGFRRWSHAGVWEWPFHSPAGAPDTEYVLIDSTGLPICTHPTPGQWGDRPQAEALQA